MRSKKTKQRKTFTSPSQNGVEKEKQKNKKGYCKAFYVTRKRKK